MNVSEIVKGNDSLMLGSNLVVESVIEFVCYMSLYVLWMICASVTGNLHKCYECSVYVFAGDFTCLSVMSN